jgi:hypothetical protein
MKVILNNKTFHFDNFEHFKATTLQALVAGIKGGVDARQVIDLMMAINATSSCMNVAELLTILREVNKCSAKLED